jgi:hypothetical protein
MTQDDPANTDKPIPSVTIDYWLERAYLYQDRLLAEACFSPNAIREICNRVGFPRHIGVIRFGIGNSGRDYVDVLVDTTSSFPNERFLAVLGGAAPDTSIIAVYLSDTLKCEFIC